MQRSLIILFTSVGLLSSCASNSQVGTKIRTIDFDEAMAFEWMLEANAVSKPPSYAPVYVQPLNKVEPCKIPSTEDQISRSNFRSFWDGQCKNGYAFGLGRDIAISDTHHLEEIIVHDGTENPSSSPSVNYDFVQNRVIYTVPEGPFPARSWFEENIRNDDRNLTIVYRLGVEDVSGRIFTVYTNPFSPLKVYLSEGKNVRFQFRDNSAAPIVDSSTVSFMAETINPQSNVNGGVMVVRNAEQFRYFKVNSGSPEPVNVPKQYLDHLEGRRQEIQIKLSFAQGKIVQAQNMEREYLFMACKKDYRIAKLAEATAKEICTWRHQFKEPYEKAAAKYQLEMTQANQRADVYRQQRQSQQQVNAQPRQLQQQQSQLEMQQLSNDLNQFSQQMQNAGQKILDSSNRYSPPAVNTVTPNMGNQVRCTTTGPYTNCRY